MSDGASPPPSPAAAPATPAPSTPVLTVVTPPPLTQLPPGTLLEALVPRQPGQPPLPGLPPPPQINPLPAGQVAVQSDLGLLILQGRVALPEGARLSLQLQPGEPVTVRLRTLAAPPATAAPTAAPTSTATRPPLAVGSIFNGTLVRPVQAQLGPAQPAPAATPAPATAAPATPASTTATPQPTVAAPTAAAATAATTPSTGQLSHLPAGTQVSVRVAGLAAAAGRGAAVTTTSTATGTPDLSVGRSTAATLVGRTAVGQPIFRIRNAAIALNARTSLPEGATATLEIVSRPTVPRSTALSPQSEIQREVLLQRDWPALREALQTVQAADPQAARQLVNAALLRPNVQMAANLLFFLSALGLGDLRGWLGEAPLRILQRARPDLAARLGEDFSQLARLADDSPAGDWRLTPVPFHNGRDFEHILLFARRQRDEDDEDGGKGTRFIIDVTLTNFGRLQLDGLLKDGKKHLDLIVRSETPLPSGVREGIRGIYREAAEVTGLKGGVGFQAAPDRMVELPVAATVEQWSGMTV